MIFPTYFDPIFSNIIYLSGSEFKNVKVDDIRALKKKIFQSTISNEPRFIIFDSIELFNINSLNALLKIIEEPSDNNFFLLINNKSKPILETIKSRCIEIKVMLNESNRVEIIESLIKKYNINSKIDFIKFNYIFDENKIKLDGNFLKNLGILLNLYKKKKEIIYIDMILFLTDDYFNNLKDKNSTTNDKIIEYKIFISENINKFFLYNLNQNALLNTINNKINGE